MPLISDAAAIYAGDLAAQAVYMGDVLVWGQGALWGPPESMLSNVAPTRPSGGTGFFTLGAYFLTVGDGRITDLKYWHAGGCPVGTTHTIGLWTTTDQVQHVAIADASGGEGAGWRIVHLPTPFEVTADTWYAISVTTDGYGYPTSPPTTSLSPNLLGLQAYYADGVAFPAIRQDGYHYHLDVIYQENLSTTEPPSDFTNPESLPGVVLALYAEDAPLGPLTVWPDRSPLANDVVQFSGSPTSTGPFVSISTANQMRTEVGMPLTGNHSSHQFSLIRTRNVKGAFMGWGSGGGSGDIFDLWNYDPGRLIWHGNGPGNDTITGAPAYAPDVWHLVECSYSAHTGSIQVLVDALPPGTAAGRTLNTGVGQMLFGSGGYNPGADFDLAALFVYDRVLDVAERSDVRAYLNDLLATTLDPL